MEIDPNVIAEWAKTVDKLWPSIPTTSDGPDTPILEEREAWYEQAYIDRLRAIRNLAHDITGY